MRTIVFWDLYWGPPPFKETTAYDMGFLETADLLRHTCHDSTQTNRGV